MHLVSKNGWNLLKAESDGVAIITFTKGERIKSVHATSVVKGWNIISLLGTAWKEADSHEITFFRASVPPMGMANGLGGSPIIPLSDQDELKPGEDDLGSEFEPDQGRVNKDGDPFMFSEGLKEMLHVKAGDQPHGATEYSTVHGSTALSQVHATTPFSGIRGSTAHSRKLG